MTRTQEALLIGGVLIAIALLAVFDIIPEAVAQYAPLAVVPILLRRSGACSTRREGQGA